MLPLNLPTYPFKTRIENGKTQIFDPIRKKYVVLNPEEWVRQHFVHFLQQEKKYPLSLMSLEHGLTYNKLSKRSDILVHNREGKPWLMVECKAPTVKISQDVFDQIARYNFVLKVPYLVVTNGLEHYCCQMDYQAASYIFLENIPPYDFPIPKS